jgi:hypothetical protein
MHLVQLSHPSQGRRTAVVEGDRLRFLTGFQSTYQLAWAAIGRKAQIDELATEDLSFSSEAIDYAPVYEGRSAWKLRVPFDHPGDPCHCLVSGTGLTHKASAANRSKMHQQAPESITDSERMYQWGLEGGSPPPGTTGVQPEWFYKGDGSILRAHGEPLTVPAFAEDGGEEPEIAGAYLIGPDGTPYRVGFVAGNEFSDHVMERRNYLYLAPSKLRECAIGPELVSHTALLNGFQSVDGIVAVERGGDVLWSAMIFTGEKNMSHTVANLEYHHFKYAAHRRPGDVHIHFYGADAFSFGAGVQLQQGDAMMVSWTGFGRPLRNTLRVEGKDVRPIEMKTL